MNTNVCSRGKFTSTFCIRNSVFDIPKGLVDVIDETGETVALATILTMVKKLDQN